jgi:NADH:ubiquinone oxidoreductase subunit 3 (subunit A)
MSTVAPSDGGYLPVVIFTLVGFAFVGFTLLFARFVRPSAPGEAKNQTYECGVTPIGEAWGPFNPHYYLYALLFVIFDVESAFLFPWALAFRKVGLYAVGEMLVFVALLVLGLAYAWRRGALQWE